VKLTAFYFDYELTVTNNTRFVRILSLCNWQVGCIFFWLDGIPCCYHGDYASA